jgi:hypothetical protein
MMKKTPEEIYESIKYKLTEAENNRLESSSNFGHDVIGVQRRVQRREAQQAAHDLVAMPGVTSATSVFVMVIDALNESGYTQQRARNALASSSVMQALERFPS